MESGPKEKRSKAQARRICGASDIMDEPCRIMSQTRILLRPPI